MENVAKLMELVNKKSADHDISVQLLNPQAVFGINHLLGIVRISLEAGMRSTLLANKLEIDILLRIAQTTQISVAFQRAGMKDANSSACIVFFTADKVQLVSFLKSVASMFKNTDGILLLPSAQKKQTISKWLGIPTDFFDDQDFLAYLLERAAILTK